MPLFALNIEVNIAGRTNKDQFKFLLIIHISFRYREDCFLILVHDEVQDLLEMERQMQLQMQHQLLEMVLATPLSILEVQNRVLQHFVQ